LVCNQSVSESAHAGLQVSTFGGYDLCNTASMSVALRLSVALFVCMCVCVFTTYKSQFTSNLHRTSHTGRPQSGEEMIRFSRSWRQRSRSSTERSASL